MIEKYYIITKYGDVYDKEREGLYNYLDVVGKLYFEKDNKGNVHLWDLYITEEYREKGYGKKIRNFVINEIKEMGCKKIMTKVDNYENNVTKKELISFYVSNFLENGARKIKIKIGKNEKIIAKFWQDLKGLFN